MIVLDTHAWIWWTAGSESIPASTLNEIESADVIGIPAICCWELAMLVAKNRIGLEMDVQAWLEIALQHKRVRLLELTPEIAVLATRLPGKFHGDPADRIIVATSLIHKACLVTKDEKIREWGYAQTMWQ
ncbi:MAG TPA: PIN domain nuclease [Candidatus Riflebacteria bacterium]|jgi:PIN domain nuclease of toxin-antitoxin system|nr:PIN domain nuclease [Candidatus Riflebacteria bacterium]